MHRRPRLNEFGRQLIAERLESGRAASVVAEELGVSRATVYKWWLALSPPHRLRCPRSRWGSCQWPLSA